MDRAPARRCRRGLSREGHRVSRGHGGAWALRQALSGVRRSRAAHRLRGERDQLLRALPDGRQAARRPGAVAPPQEELAALHRRAGLVASAAILRLVGRSEKSDQVRALLRIRNSGIGHRGAGDRVRGVGEKAVERFLVPNQAGFLHRARVGEPRDAAGAPPKQAAMPRPYPVVGERVAGQAARVDLLAAQRVARREHRGERHRFNQDTNAAGTGFSPITCRNTAQCIASSPRMLAAAFDRSRAANKGTAPCSRPAAKRSTSSWFFSVSTGKLYFAFAEAGLPPSLRMVLSSRSACALWWPWNCTARSSAGFCSRLLSAPTW